MSVIGLVLLWLAGSCAALAIAFRREIAAAWREPVLRAPVLILESDDWGYGPSEQAQRLRRIAASLARFRDRLGRHPVMTLGVVLGGPDTERIRAGGYRTYHRLTLADRRFDEVRNAMLDGVELGVFTLQLHGMEHFWPDTLMRIAAGDGAVRDWLSAPGFPATETLPSALQSRWIDAAVLPSRPLAEDDIQAAAAAEASAFSEVFGARAEVVVPPTFVWSSVLEKAWARTGIRVVVTPGRRCEGRDATGAPEPSGETYYNGQIGPDDVLYVVRDRYFEPSLGHTRDRAIEALRSKTHVARPALLEIHRMNFIGDEAQARGSLDEVEALLESACAGFPDLRFMSAAELARHYRKRTEMVEARLGPRIHFLLRRLAEVSRLRKLAGLSGAIVVAWIAYLFTRPQAGKAVPG